MTVASEKKVIIYQGDISEKAYNYFSQQDVLGCDTETNGLDPKTKNLQLTQIASRDNKIALIQFRKEIEPVYIRKLMADSNITKVFHHAPFDLGFLGIHAKAQFNNIFCTKIASVKVRGNGGKGFHKLSTVSKEVLGVDLDKSLMDPNNLPDWTGELTPKHIEYATDDVVVLIPLYDYFIQKLTASMTEEVKTAAVKNNASYY